MMVSVFFISLLLSDVVWAPLDKLPLIVFGLVGLYYLGAYRRFRISLAELFYLAFCSSMLFTAISVGFTGNILSYLFLFILQIGLISFIVTKQNINKWFIVNSIESFINWSVAYSIIGAIDFIMYEVGISSIIRDYYYTNKVDSFYGSPNIFGIMSAFALMFLLRQEGLKARSFLKYAKMVALLIAILLSQSGMALGLLLFYILLEKLSWLKILLLAFLLVFGVLLFEMYYGVLNIPIQIILNKRFELWEAAFEMWKQSKVFGIGTGNFQLTNAVTFDADITGQSFGLHSMYMWLIIETGIVGFVLFAVILWCLIIKIRLSFSKYEMPFLILLLISQLTESFLQYEELYMMLFWLLAMSFGRDIPIFVRKKCKRNARPV